MPVFSSAAFLDCIKHLVHLDREWFPDMEEPGQLYVRMNHFSTDPALGVKTPF